MTVSSALRGCADCLRRGSADLVRSVQEVHASSRTPFGLPERVPDARDGTRCRFCARECRIPDGGLGFCGLRAARGKRLVHLGGMPHAGVLSWYFDPLPTNCVAAWVCGERYPERGTKNLAVFYGGCGFDCVFCQNWSHKELAMSRSSRLGAEELADRVRDDTACVCFFGGDPSPQLPHSLATARHARAQRPRVRICWETNGSMNRAYLRRAAEIALRTGGTIKFDLKAWDERLHEALCGIGNRRTLENFQWLAERGSTRPDPPLAVASTLLVPGYVDADEVGAIARFVAGLDPNVPYSLLAFHPQFLLHDLPTTAREQAERCLESARAAGLRRVRIGNRHLLS